MTEEEIKASAEKSAKEIETARAEVATAKAEAETIKVEKEKVEKELKGLRNKDFNFRRLESMTQEEKDALTEKELELQKRAEVLEDRQTQHDKAIKDDWRNSAIERYSKGDSDKAKKIVEALKDLSGDEHDRSSIEAKVAKAAKLSREDKEFDHVGSAFGNFNGAPPEPPAEKGFGETEEGAALANKLGFRFAKKK